MRVLTSLPPLFKSRIFIMAFVFFAILVLGLSSLQQPVSFYSYSPSYGGVDSRYYTLASWSTNNTNLSVYSQTFNSYGRAVDHWNITYSISSSVDGNRVMASGEGITNSTGFIKYNVSGLSAGQVYILQEKIWHNKSASVSYSANIISLLNVSDYERSNYLTTVFVRPVLTPNSNEYSMFLWLPDRIYGGNYTVKYGSTTYNFSNFAFATQNKMPGNITKLKVHLNYMTVIRTDLPLAGPPQLYMVKIDNSHDEVVGFTFFAIRIEGVYKSILSSSFTFGIEVLFLMLYSRVFSEALYDTNPQNVSRLSRFLFGKSIKWFMENKFSEQGMGVSLVVVLSLPILLVSVLFNFLLSQLLYHHTPPYTYGLSYFLGLLVVVMLSSSITVMLLSFRRRRAWKRGMPKGNSGRKRRYWITFAVTYALTYFYLYVNLDGFFYLFFGNATMIKLTLISNLVNPLSYLWLLSELLTRNLFIGDLFPFSPRAYGITPLVLLILGIFWVAVIVILPSIVSHRSQKLNK